MKRETLKEWHVNMQWLRIVLSINVITVDAVFLPE